MRTTELLAALRRQHVMCAGFESDDLAKDREAALDYYFMRPNGTEVTGRSTAVSGDVSAMVESNLAAMMEAFGAKQIVEFDSVDAADEDQAQLESDACTHFMSRNNGRWQLGQAIKEVLRLRNGWTKTYVEEERRTEIEEWRNVTPESLLELTERPGVEECKVLEFDPEKGYLKTRCVYRTKRFRCEAVAPENVVYPKAYDGCDFEALQRIPYIAERHVETRGAAIKRGFDREKVLGMPECRSDSVEASARNPRKDPSLTPGHDPLSELVEWWEIYALVEVAGESERQLICTDAKFKKRLLREPVRIVPYSTGQCFIAPNRLTGVSVWDKLRQTQDINTGLTRALLDNVQATSKSRLAYSDGKVNVDDVSDGRVNGAIRVKASVPDVRSALMPFVVPDTSQGIKDAIQHQRQIRTELGGSSLDMQSGELQVSKQVGSLGLDRAFSVAEQLAAHMTQNVADTLIRSTYLVAHAQLREHFDEAVPIKRNGRWTQTVPAQWPAREGLTVKIGMSPGERARQQGALDMLITTHLELTKLGMEGVLTNLDGFYTLLMDRSRIAGVAHPERYFIDPRSEASAKAQQQKGQAAAAEREKQANLLREAVTIEKVKVAQTKYDGDADRAVDVWKHKVDAAIEYAKLGQQAELDEAKLVVPAAAELLRGKRDGQAKGRSAAEGEPPARADAA